MDTPQIAHSLQPDNGNDNLSHLLVTQLDDPWYRTLTQSLRDLVNPPTLPPLEVTSKPVKVVELETEWRRSLSQNLRDLIRPTKLPPLELTSKPVPVMDIWGLYGRRKKSFLVSTGLQAAVVAMLFVFGATKPGHQAVVKAMTLLLPVDLAPHATPKKPSVNVGGGGGDRSPLPASLGNLPKPAPRQYTPPEAVNNNLNPKLTMIPSIIAPPDAALPQVDSDHYGDPFSKSGILSNGPGSRGGIGSGAGGGVGSQEGPGAGPGDSGFGVGRFRPGDNITRPELVHKVDPEYSEDARKAKYSGTVVLLIEIDSTGHATDIRVGRSLGMGLDEKAIEAVKKWVFVPGRQNGKPVTLPATVEVNFRLL
ncbi:MAG: energy transducer TonB [Bryobacteraceae bacterium]|jgi:TonB family protein